MNPSESLFPVFLKLTGRKVVLVGGGTVATSKLGALLDTGAAVTVVAPQITRKIASSNAVIRRRGFEPADLNAAWLVVAAAPPAVNREVSRAAESRNLFVNAVDDPPNASVYLGGVVRRSGVTVAISTDGKAPALAGLIRQALDTLLPEKEVKRWLSVAQTQRATWTKDNVAIDQRRPLLLRALAGLYQDE